MLLLLLLVVQMIVELNLAKNLDTHSNCLDRLVSLVLDTPSRKKSSGGEDKKDEKRKKKRISDALKKKEARMKLGGCLFLASLCS